MPQHGAVDPARPDVRLTEQGRRVREVVSYTRRGGRFTTSQQRAWDRYAERWWVPEERAAFLDPTTEFGRDAPLVVEIGSGVGEATVALAATRPDCNVLAFEVWRPGIADTLGRLGAAGVDNVRLCSLDATWALRERVARMHELWTFFPDPWPKTRHHKRRLVGEGLARLVADRLAPGGVWRLATDWPAYAEQMRAVLDAEPRLDGGTVERWQERPVTRFERRALEDGRPSVDLCYRRIAESR